MVPVTAAMMLPQLEAQRLDTEKEHKAELQKLTETLAAKADKKQVIRGHESPSGALL
jgi:hypothetical protein